MTRAAGSGPRLLRALAFALLAASAAAGCASGGGTSAPEDFDPDLGVNDPALVVAMGDSITFGLGDAGVDSCDERFRIRAGFCPRLQQLTGKIVLNEGACGERSRDAASRIREVLQRWQPGVILIDYTPNDLFEGTNAVIGNLRLMISVARRNKTVPVLGTLVPAAGEHEGWEPFIESVNARIRALCLEEGIECADHWRAFTEDPAFAANPFALLNEDGLHPNAAGYSLMARTWRWALLRVY